MYVFIYMQIYICIYIYVDACIYIYTYIYRYWVSSQDIEERAFF